MSARPARLALAATLLPLLQACSEDATLPAPRPTAHTDQLTCRARPRQGLVSCAATSPLPASRNLIGGQGIYVRVASSDTRFDAGNGILSSKVTVQNLLPYPMGTTGDHLPYGMNVVFHAGPYTTGGTGQVRVENPDGYLSATGAQQPYFHYPEVLGSREVSAPREWRFAVDPGVEWFEFQLFVETRLPIDEGVLRWEVLTLCNGCILHHIWNSGGDTLLVAGEQAGVGLVLRSLDGGRSWSPGVLPAGTNAVIGITGGEFTFALARAGGDSLVLRSYDAGGSWQVHLSDPSFRPSALWSYHDSQPTIGGRQCVQLNLHPDCSTHYSEVRFPEHTGRRMPVEGGELVGVRGDGYDFDVVMLMNGGKSVEVWAFSYFREQHDQGGFKRELMVEASPGGTLRVEHFGENSRRAMWLVLSQEGAAPRSLIYRRIAPEVPSPEWLPIVVGTDVRFRSVWGVDADHFYFTADGPPALSYWKAPERIWPHAVPAGTAGLGSMTGISTSDIFILRGGGEVLHGFR